MRVLQGRKGRVVEVDEGEEAKVDEEVKMGWKWVDWKWMLMDVDKQKDARVEKNWSW